MTPLLAALVALWAPTAPFDLVDASPCARCHPAVVAQWQASTHAHSSLDNPWYLGALKRFEAERPGQLEFCGQCHDPALIRAQALRTDATGPAARAGVGCSLCHSLEAAPVTGNGEYALTDAPHPLRRPAHGERALPAGLRSATRCATCHEVRLPEDVTRAHWQRGQSDWFDWYDGPWAGRGVDVVLRPEDGIRPCVDCHMPKVAVGRKERARDAQGQVRDHRFLGSHVALASLRGDEATVAALRARLDGVIALDLATAKPGFVDVVMRNVGVGHAFPGGTQDAKQAWLELTAWDKDGQVVRARGHLDDGGRLPPDAWRLGARPVDAQGYPVPARAAWTQRAVVGDTRLRPGVPQVARFAVPERAVKLRVRLRLRRVGPDDGALLCGPDAPRGCREVPVTDVAVAEAEWAGDRVPGERPWRALLAHGLGLTFGLSAHVAEAGALIQAAAAAAPEGAAEIPLALARHAAVQGRTDDVVAVLRGVEDPRARWLEANALARAFRHKAGREAAERLVDAAPDDRRALALLARLRGLTGDPAGALEAADRLLAIDPQSDPGLYQRYLALRFLRRPADQVAEAEAQWLRHRRRDELDRALRDSYRRVRPGDRAMETPVGPD